MIKIKIIYFLHFWVFVFFSLHSQHNLLTDCFYSNKLFSSLQSFLKNVVTFFIRPDKLNEAHLVLSFLPLKHTFS